MSRCLSGSGRSLLARFLPGAVKTVWRRFRMYRETRQRAVITTPRGRLLPGAGPMTFIAVVGRRFDQRKPNAMLTCRLGYCHAFEKMGIPYLICDERELPHRLPELPRPFCFVFGADVPEMSAVTLAALQTVPVAVWANPWFKGELEFFASHGLSPETWVWPAEHRRRILEMSPRFVFTATVESGLEYFSSWTRQGLRVVSLPLACDTAVYLPDMPPEPEFNGIELAFVGGYWASKGRQIDRYLRPFEDRLVIYGYNRWPYRGYRGRLHPAAEPALYRQAAVCPTINEPTVALLHGQINERVFKILGAGGCTVVDAVPAYRALFSTDELFVPENEREFADRIHDLLADADLRRREAERGRAAVLARHTYSHRARQVLCEFSLGGAVAATPPPGPP